MLVMKGYRCDSHLGHLVINLLLVIYSDYLNIITIFLISLIGPYAMQKRRRFGKFKLSWTRKIMSFDGLGLDSSILKRDSVSTRVIVPKNSHSKVVGLGLTRVLRLLESMHIWHLSSITQQDFIILLNILLGKIKAARRSI